MASTEPDLVRGASPLQLEPLGVYIHIPFCSSICNYCNFNRGLYDEGLKTRYVDALLGDIRHSPLAPSPRLSHHSSPLALRRSPRANTIFFGGGTPSLLDPRDVAAILAAIRDRFAVDPDSEVTLETNPETVDCVTLERFRAAGVNRLSFG
ncbi:MAG TPA: radical SAM protein, partial [Vicinamibacterales bacterium]|nr:radical SAM protein [Vicinamibacterales bacterium]